MYDQIRQPPIRTEINPKFYSKYNFVVSGRIGRRYGPSASLSKFVETPRGLAFHNETVEVNAFLSDDNVLILGASPRTFLVDFTYNIEFGGSMLCGFGDYFITNNNHQSFYDGGGGTWSFQYWSDSVQAGTGLTVGKRYQLAMTYDGTTIKTYCNGIFNSSAAATLTTTATQLYSGDVYFGSTPCDVHLIAISDKCLSPTEMMGYYLNPWSVFAPEPKHMIYQGIAAAPTQTATPFWLPRKRSFQSLLAR